MHIFTGMTRDNLKINVRESAEMDQADLELRATIMKVSSRSFSHSHHDHLIILTSPPWSSYHSHIATMIILSFSHCHHDHFKILSSPSWSSYDSHIANMIILSFSHRHHDHLIIFTEQPCPLAIFSFSHRHHDHSHRFGLWLEQERLTCWFQQKTLLEQVTSPF